MCWGISTGGLTVALALGLGSDLDKRAPLEKEACWVRLVSECLSLEKLHTRFDQRRINSDNAIKRPMPITARLTNVRPSLRASPAPP